jgi:hypothetical protein
MGRRGRKRWLSVENAYWKLILSGVGPVEAARQILYRTHDRLRMLDADRHTRYLSSPERERPAVLRRDGLSYERSPDGSRVHHQRSAGSGAATFVGTTEASTTLSSRTPVRERKPSVTVAG